MTIASSELCEWESTWRRRDCVRRIASLSEDVRLIEPETL